MLADLIDRAVADKTQVHNTGNGMRRASDQVILPRRLISRSPKRTAVRSCPKVTTSRSRTHEQNSTLALMEDRRFDMVNAGDAYRTIVPNHP